MKELEDIDLVNNIKNDNCNTSIIELYSRHEKLCLSIIYKLSKRFQAFLLIEEIKNDIHYIIYCSAIKFKDNKATKFSTFLANETKWCFFNKMNALIKKQNHLKLNDLIKTQQTDIFEENNSETIYDISMNLLKNIPDKRVADIFSLRYEIGKKNSNKVMPWHEVGEKMNLSSQGCINLHSTGIKFIKEKLTKEGINNAK
jgi:hypothetical protein